MTPDLLLSFVPVSLLALILCLLIPNHREKALSGVAIFAIALQLVLYILLLVQWIQGNFAPLQYGGMVLYAGAEYTFALRFYFDLISAVFMGGTILMTLLIFLFSKFYMHRDPGFKRFYSTVLIFFMGLTLIILGGNFETLFLGWEAIGMSSFVLVAFYRDRFLPAKNALKVFTLYRIADALLLIALWYAHHLYETNIIFANMAGYVLHHGNSSLVLGILFVLVALIKSAQFPFSYWLPRAMEGPTTSSAIFYGALSVHMGLFLLLRTAPLWEGNSTVLLLLGAFGLVSALIGTSIARVQSTIKAQIAYASITQIGIMFIEVALGFHELALFHFVSNAFLRAYQLLISPSIVGYLIHNQFFHFVTPAHKLEDTFLGRLRATWYVLGIKEWNMDVFFSHYLWKPVKATGRLLGFMETLVGQLGMLALFAVLSAVSLSQHLTQGVSEILATLALLFSVLLFIRAFSSKRNPKTAWNNVFLGHLFTSLFLGIFSHFDWKHLIMYISGVFVAYILGQLSFSLLAKKGESQVLAHFHGHFYEYAVLGNFFFIVCLAFMAFPITPSFLGEEILLGHLHSTHVLQILLFVFGYVLSGVATLRIFAKLFFGPHHKTYHEIAYKSS